jgi:hypothetical protein
MLYQQWYVHQLQGLHLAGSSSLEKLKNSTAKYIAVICSSSLWSLLCLEFAVLTEGHA